MEHNTETLKRLSSNSDKPNNQVKLANVGAAALPPGHIKCNILKARVEEELGSTTNAKMTNQMFVPAASTLSNNNNNNHIINNNNNNHTHSIHHSDGPDSLNATYISVGGDKLTLSISEQKPSGGITSTIASNVTNTNTTNLFNTSSTTPIGGTIANSPPLSPFSKATFLADFNVHNNNNALPPPLSPIPTTTNTFNTNYTNSNTNNANVITTTNNNNNNCNINNNYNNSSNVFKANIITESPPVTISATKTANNLANASSAATETASAAATTTTANNSLFTSLLLSNVTNTHNSIDNTTTVTSGGKSEKLPTTTSATNFSTTSAAEKLINEIFINNIINNNIKQKEQQQQQQQQQQLDNNTLPSLEEEEQQPTSVGALLFSKLSKQEREEQLQKQMQEEYATETNRSETDAGSIFFKDKLKCEKTNNHHVNHIPSNNDMVSPWLVSSEVVTAPKSKDPQIIRKSVITTQL